jgi:hypothetical protein
MAETLKAELVRVRPPFDDAFLFVDEPGHPFVMVSVFDDMSKRDVIVCLASSIFAAQLRGFGELQDQFLAELDADGMIAAFLGLAEDKEAPSSPETPLDPEVPKDEGPVMVRHELQGGITIEWPEALEKELVLSVLEGYVADQRAAALQGTEGGTSEEDKDG